jgi:sigma-B regulation protein RsbU (phosphoserine phosphatase)
MQSAAFVVSGTPRAVLAFGLVEGWERDDLDFALATNSNAINHRQRVRLLETDFEQAAEIQRSLLPATAPSLEGYSIAARSAAAATVGGDFYDFVNLDPDIVGIGIGDASGHGLGAALLARDVVTGLRMGAEKDLRITSVIQRLNRVINRSALSTRFASLFYGELETNGNFFYVNAGHPPPWLYGEKGIRRLPIGGTILGPLKEAAFKRGFAHVDRGDTLLLITDGLIEHTNSQGVPLGDEGVATYLRELHGRPPDEIIDALFRRAGEYGGGRVWTDDATAIAVTRATTRD